MDEIESLCRVLDEETRVCTALTGVLRAEQAAVVHLRPEAIVACLEERQSVHDTLAALAATRRALVRGLAGRYGGAAGTTATSLVPFLPLERRGRVQSAVKRLRRALLEARGLERQNALLAGAGAAHVNELLAALRALVPGMRYDAAARLAPPAQPERVDRRA